MKSTKKFLSLFIAFAMILGTFCFSASTINAAEDVTNTVTLHKMLLGKDSFNSEKFPGTTGVDGKTNYNGNQITELGKYFGQGAKEIGGVYFAVKYASGDNAGKYVKADANDKLAPASPLAATENVKEAVGGLTTTSGIAFKTALLKGDFEIVEVQDLSKYKGDNGELLSGSKAVPVKITLPLVNDDGVVSAAHVYPKNIEDKPEIDKNFAKNNGLTKVTDTQNNQNDGAKYGNYQKDKATVTADLGKEIPYDVKTKIPQHAKYKKLVWNDVMTKGLTFKEGSLVVNLDGAALKAGDYTVVQDARGFELKFTKAGLDKVEKAAATKTVEIQLLYSATINKDAVVDIPEANDIKFDYSNKPGKDSEPKEGQPKNQQISVEKSWATDGNHVTEDDRNAVVVYTLQEKVGDTWKSVQTVTKKYDEKNPQDSFKHTFTGLDDSKTYRVVERVSGYDPEYLSFVDGVVQIKNHKDSDNPNTLNPTEPKVVLGGKKFVKTNDVDKNSKDLERLAGAEFYVKNQAGKYLVAKKANAQAVADAKTALDNAVKAYNNMSAADQKGEKGTEAKNLINEKQVAYNKVFKDNAVGYTWGEKTDKDVVILTSDGEGRFEITGLEYAQGNYQLEEKTPPEGFAKLNATVPFDVAKGSYQGKAEELQYNKADTNAGYGKQIRNKKVSIPQTGGIGSIIFVAAGLLLMALAVYKIKSNRVEA